MNKTTASILLLLVVSVAFTIVLPAAEGTAFYPPMDRRTARMYGLQKRSNYPPVANMKRMSLLQTAVNKRHYQPIWL